MGNQADFGFENKNQLFTKLLGQSPMPCIAKC